MIRRFTLAIAAALALGTAALPAPLEADEAAETAAVNAAENALDDAFGRRDEPTIRALMTPDHITVTPYYDGIQTVDDQIASLAELDYGETIVGEPRVVFLSPDVALRTFVAELQGSFRGKPLPARVFVNETVVRRDGKWVEALFQVTALP
ncbi:MAG: nuclear transport factor 2 family protein [Rhizobiales bacterium]|nr:nuclear transport factor 2 family protein [Hyphomicrobiales bacterium]